MTPESRTATPVKGRCSALSCGGGEGTRTLEPPDCQSGALPAELRPRRRATLSALHRTPPEPVRNRPGTGTKPRGLPEGTLGALGRPIRCVGRIRGDERPGGNRCCPVATDAAPDAICMAFRSHCVALETGELSGMSNVADMGVSASKCSQ